MALMIGELTGIITLDDRTVDPTLRRVQQAMRQAGQRMGDDAQRTGRQVGDDLGGGMVRGADGQWRNMRGQLVNAVRVAGDDATRAARQAGDDAGDALGDGLGEGGSDGAEQAADDIGATLKERLKAGAIGIGLAAGAVLMDAFGQALEQGKIVGKLAAGMGKTPAEAQKYGHIAGQLYADAVTEDFQGAADVIGAVMAAGLVPPDATNDQIRSIAENLHDLSDTFELDLGQTANAVGQMLKTGLAKDGKEAIDALTVGLQKMGPRADDIADTFNEYSTIFRQMGISASDATGLLSQGMQAGARDTDVVADSLKEFVLITQKGGKSVDQAFAKIGLSGSEMQKVFSKGGPEAKKALDQVFDRMRSLKDPTDRAQLALALFGTKAEDTQKALFALDPSEATKALGEVGGAADKMGDSLRDNGATRIEAFKRGLQQHLVDFIGMQVLPALTDVKDTVGHLWDDAGKGGKEGADRVVAFFGLVGQRLLVKAKELLPKAIAGLQQFGENLAAYITSNPESALKISLIAGAIIAAMVALPLLIAGAIATSATIIMVKFVQKMISSLNDNIPKWWDSFAAWHRQQFAKIPGLFNSLGTAIGNWFSGLWSRYVAGPVSRQWASFLTSVRGLPGKTVTALNPLGGNLSGVSSRAWQAFRNAAGAKWNQFVGWLSGLPGRVRSSVAGGMSNALYGPGQNVVTGLWRGISSLGGWLYSKIANFVSSNVVSAAKSFLHIGSPSRLMADEVGRWIPPGIAQGIDKNAGVVADSMANLVDVPSPSASFASGMAAAAGRTAGGTASSSKPTVRIEVAGPEEVTRFIRGVVVDKGGGNVQLAFGRGSG